MPWSEGSFLVETKPQAEYASLYVACVENDPRDIVRIIQDGIDLCSTDEIGENQPVTDMIIDQLGDLHLDDGSDFDHLTSTAQKGGSNCNIKIDPSNEEKAHKNLSTIVKQNGSFETNEEEPPTSTSKHNPTLCALIKGIKMDPSSVKNYSWTDDQQTFSCKLKLDLVDEENGEKRSWQEAFRSAKISSGGLEKYCDCLNKSDLVLKCNKCDQILHRDCELKALKYYKLPSCEFNEIVDELYCHQHHYGAFDNNIKYSYFVNGPKADQCFISSYYLLLNADVTDNCILLDSNMIVCKNCRQNVGCLDIAPSSRYFPRKNCYRFYHIATTLLGKLRTVPPEVAVEQNFFATRYPTKEQYFSWLILSELEYYATLYYVIRSLDNRPKLMVWILDTFTVLAYGKLLDSEVPRHNGKVTPFPAVKFLYRRLNESDLSDPFVMGHQTGVVDVHLPMDACEMFFNFLETSCEEMPMACRTLGKFKVGFLPSADEI